MFVCEDCQSKYEETRLVKEDYGQEHPGCPICGSENYEELQACPRCHEYVREIQFTSAGPCLDCMKELCETAAEAVNGIMPPEDVNWFYRLLDCGDTNMAEVLL